MNLAYSNGGCLTQLPPLNVWKGVFWHVSLRALIELTRSLSTLYDFSYLVECVVTLTLCRIIVCKGYDFTAV